MINYRTLFMLGDASGAFEAGQIAGRIFFVMLVLTGIGKCYAISRRPATNTKCALSLLLFLLSLVFSSGLTMLPTEIGHGSIVFALRIALVLLGMLTLFGSLVLATIGLLEYQRQKEQYIQGRVQAISTLILTSVVMVFGVVGFIRARQAAGFGNTGAIRPGKITTLDDLNFRYRAPDRPWVSYDAAKVNKVSKLGFMRRNPEAYFQIIAEKLATELTPEQMAEISQGSIRAASTSLTVLSEKHQVVNGLNGLLRESHVDTKGYHFYYQHWYFATNGYAYQLVSYCSVEFQDQMAREFADLLPGFNLIDPDRKGFIGGFETNYSSRNNNFTVVVTNSLWHQFANLETSSPHAEFGASQQDSALVVIPVSLEGVKIKPEALNFAFLGLFNVAFPNENLINPKPVSDGNIVGQQYDYSREIEGKMFRYRFKMVKADSKGYLVAAWTQRTGEAADAVLDDAINRVNFFPDPSPGSSQSGDESLTEKERDTRAFVINQAGVYHSKHAEYELALPLFCAAARADKQKSIYAVNSLQTWMHLDRPREALDFAGTLPPAVLALKEVRADQAFFQERAGFTDEAITNYASVFADGYREESHLTEYVNLLIAQKQFDAALKTVQDYLAKGTSIFTRLLEAQVYRQKKDLPAAIKKLKELREQAPFNSQVAAAMVEAYIQAKQYSDALPIAKELARDNDNSAYDIFLRGQSELGLKWYREAKVSFGKAVTLAPANKEIRSYLDYVSGLLGEGDNSAVMEAIDPVVVPAAVVSAAVEPAPADYAKNYGAYYNRRVVAAVYTPGKEYKSTEFLNITVRDASGVSEFSTMQFTFDPLGEQLFVNEVRVMDPEGKTISEGKVANYYVLDDPAATSASQKKVLNVPVPGLVPGCQLLVTLTRRQQGKEFPFCSHYFSSTFPVRESIFYLNDTQGLKYVSKPAMEPQKVGSGLCWRVSDPVIARWEPLQPSAATFLPALWIADGGAQWSELATNYLASIADRLELDPALRTRAQKLVAGLDTDDAKITAIANFVQTNLTYKAIEFGLRARIPNKPAETVGNKYGDCKDHAVLLQQMLAAGGIDSQLTLASHRGPVQKNLPSLDQFDHMIVFVPGNGHFLDCTSKGADVAHAIPAELEGEEVFVLDAHYPRFVTIPNYTTNAASVSVEQHIHLTDLSDAVVEETLTYSGTHASGMRAYLKLLPASSRNSTLQHQMEMGDATLKDVKIEGLASTSEPLRVTFVYSLKKQFRRSQGLLRGVLRAGFARVYLETTPVENRLSPFEIKLPAVVEETAVIDVPAGYRAEKLENLNAECDPRFARCEEQAKVEGRQLKLRFKFERPAGEFKASDYAAYRETMSQALSLLEREVVFKAE